MITSTGPSLVYEAEDAPDFVGDSCIYGSHTHDVDVPEGGGVDLGTVTPNSCLAGVINLSIGSHDVHVLKETFNPVSGDEPPYSVGVLAGYIKLDNVEQIVGTYIALNIQFDSFPTECNKIMANSGCIAFDGTSFPVTCEADPSHWSMEGDATLTKLTVVISPNSLLTIPAHSNITLYL